MEKERGGPCKKYAFFSGKKRKKKVSTLNFWKGNHKEK
jgi:hypothetical protein